MHFGSLNMSFESNNDIKKEVPNLVSLITSIVFNNLFGVENYIFGACE